MRTANIKRDTRETRIQLALNLDGTGRSGVSTGKEFTGPTGPAPPPPPPPWDRKGRSMRMPSGE